MNTILRVWFGMTVGGLALVCVGAAVLYPMLFGLVLGGLAPIAVGYGVMVVSATSAPRNRSLDEFMEDKP